MSIFGSNCCLLFNKTTYMLIALYWRLFCDLHWIDTQSRLSLPLITVLNAGQLMGSSDIVLVDKC